jgi:hypothetical protein
MEILTNEQPKQRSARERILEHFKENVGRVVDRKDIQEVAQISDWARRIRELRDEFGWDISSFNDDASLKPGQYRLESTEPGPVSLRHIAPEQRTRILKRDDYACQFPTDNGKCGLRHGDPDPNRLGKRVRLELDHLQPISTGGDNSDDNLQILCSYHNKLRGNLYGRDGRINLLELVQNRPHQEQLEIYQFLKKKFESR